MTVPGQDQQPRRPRRIADRYEVSPLDGGGMATVWRGYDTVLDRWVAIKQIRPDRNYSPAVRRELVERFRREARVTAKIEHPGVPAVYDAAIDLDGDAGIERLYLVMQLVHGTTLSDVLAGHGPLPVSWVVSIAAQVCAVLSYAHAIPVVHRDLKPSNIMISADGTVKVLDFGVAAVLGTDITRLTETGRMIGSRDYMSPEQFHGVTVSPRSDLYALGCLLHEMLTGRKLFDSSRDPALQHVHEPPTPVRTLRPEVDEAIERLILDLLAKAPDDRPPSAQQVFERLAPFLPGPEAALPDAGTSVGDDVPDPTRPYRRPLAPRQPDPARPRHPEPSRVLPAFPDDVVAALELAEERAAGLIDDSRFTQAVQVLDEALSAARPYLPGDHPQLLEVRNTYAAALFLGGDYRRALVVFADLATAYARVAGPDDERVRGCRVQAAYCHAELGDTEAALAEFQAILEDETRRGHSTVGSEALELRRQIGVLLLAAHRLDAAADVLHPLLRDLSAARGADDPVTQEVHELLTRIELTRDAPASGSS